MNKISEKFYNSLDNERKRRIYRISYLVFLVILFLCSLVSRVHVKEEKEYSDFRHIVAYIFEYDVLPSNYIPMSNSGTVIGEDLYLYEPFMNYEGLLPARESYISAYYDATKTNVGSKRIVFSSSEVFFTENHYESFDKVTRFQIYGFHYFSLSCFWILFVGGGVIIILSIKNGYITTTVIKNDFDTDCNYIKEKIQIIWRFIRMNISSIFDKRKS